ncbi:hypothetical protein ACFYTQ_30910 [Nocardia sp. NPDC004068]|uniref:hypothetical protein n=1 Tax=Nocardia sp. NPDC004068 TaxID=3364303 RepID=UPI0036AE9F20
MASETYGGSGAGTGDTAYLAGPFTSMLAPNGRSGLIGQGTSIIPATSPWRQALTAAEAALRSLGWRVFLPHRDVSGWGVRRVSSDVVVRECLDAVLNSDLVVALLGQSFGTHIEVGAALGQRIPTIVVQSGDLPASYFATGFGGTSSYAACLTIESVEDLPNALRGEAFTEALSRARMHARGCAQAAAGSRQRDAGAVRVGAGQRKHDGRSDSPVASPNSLPTQPFPP